MLIKGELPGVGFTNNSLKHQHFTTSSFISLITQTGPHTCYISGTVSGITYPLSLHSLFKLHRIQVLLSPFLMRYTGTETSYAQEEGHTIQGHTASTKWENPVSSLSRLALEPTPPVTVPCCPFPGMLVKPCLN